MISELKGYNKYHEWSYQGIEPNDEYPGVLIQQYQQSHPNIMDVEQVYEDEEAVNNDLSVDNVIDVANFINYGELEE